MSVNLANPLGQIDSSNPPLCYYSNFVIPNPLHITASYGGLSMHVTRLLQPHSLGITSMIYDCQVRGT